MDSCWIGSSVTQIFVCIVLWSYTCCPTMSMLVRKGTMVRKKRGQSLRRAASPKPADPEHGKFRVTDQSTLKTPTRAYQGSYSVGEHYFICLSCS